MKNYSKVNIITGIISALLFIVGLFSHSYFFKATLPQIDGLTYQADSPTRGFGMVLLYCLTLAAIPVVSVVIWKQTKANSALKKVLVPLLLITCVFVSVLIRHNTLSSELKKAAYFSQLVADVEKSQNHTRVSLNEIDLEKYMFIGLLAGVLITYLVLSLSKPTANKRLAASGG